MGWCCGGEFLEIGRGCVEVGGLEEVLGVVCWDGGRIEKGWVGGVWGYDEVLYLVDDVFVGRV